MPESLRLLTLKVILTEMPDRFTASLSLKSY